MEVLLSAEINAAELEKRRVLLAEALFSEYISIAELDLSTGIALILKSEEDAELEGREISWNALLQRYNERRTHPEDMKTVYSLTNGYLEKFLEHGFGELALEVRCALDEDSYGWVKIAISILSASERKLLITTRNINEDRILQSVVDLYVFQNMDYFILVDAKHDKYTMFSGKGKGIPVPPKHFEDYTTEMIKYNEKYVAPEDVERVTANMRIANIVEMLDKEDTYCFSSSGVKDDGGYRRTRVQYQYYDRAMGLILLTRTDITEIFMEEQAKHNRLSAALRDAQQDALTGIYNQKAVSELVSGALESGYLNKAVFLFIDIDNFKMVNDTLGHQTGDRILKHLATHINNFTGHGGLAARVGGDEFLLFLPIDFDREAVERCAESICKSFEGVPEIKTAKLPLSCSIGISTFPKDGSDYHTLVKKADKALYTSKRLGKNRYCHYSDRQK